ncbi:MAG: hypothetical protein IT370_00565 [Deltaproteobacteria bacterium]|nr:hypothetical protein [Deltaproteobacteria bacterium]
MSNPEKPDVRKVAQDIREALAEYSREQLVEMLTHVFQSYVVEGPAPVSAAQPERLPELEGMAFPKLIETLQLRLDLPELAWFSIVEGRVQVRAGGMMQPLGGAGGAAEPVQLLPTTPAPAPAPAAAAPARPVQPAPGVNVEQRPQPPGAPAGRPMSGEEMRFHEQRIEEQRRAQQQAPRPTRGLSVSGNAGGARPGGAPQQPAGAPAAPAAAGGAAPAQPAKPKDLELESDAAARSRLLEID